MGSDAKACANGILRFYCQRNQMLGFDLFAGSGWEALLILFVAASPLSAKEIALQANHSESTTTRWLKILAERGLVAPESLAANEGKFSLTEKGDQCLTFLLGSSQQTQAA